MRNRDEGEIYLLYCILFYSIFKMNFGSPHVLYNLAYNTVKCIYNNSFCPWLTSFIKVVACISWNYTLLATTYLQQFLFLIYTVWRSLQHYPPLPPCKAMMGSIMYRLYLYVSLVLSYHETDIFTVWRSRHFNQFFLVYFWADIKI